VLKPFLSRLATGADLTRREAGCAMDIIMEGQTDDAQIAAFAMALRVKGETADEIAGCAASLRRRGETIAVGRSLAARIVDTCGTGGDGLGTFNVSTVSALVATGAGLPVAKHGNRSVSSRCGSADLLEALGVPVHLGPEEAAACLERTGIVFLFAPRYHKAMRHAVAARRSIGTRTIFNLLGPLCNPAGARRQVIGVFVSEAMLPMGRVLRASGAKRALLVHGHDGMDELTVTGLTMAIELRDGRLARRTFRPESAGLRRWPLAALRGGDPAANARIARQVLEGRKGAARDIVLLNAGAALWIGAAARTLREGVAQAADAIDRGLAAATLERLAHAGTMAKEGGS